MSRTDIRPLHNNEEVTADPAVDPLSSPPAPPSPLPRQTVDDVPTTAAERLTAHTASTKGKLKELKGGASPGDAALTAARREGESVARIDFDDLLWAAIEWYISSVAAPNLGNLERLAGGSSLADLPLSAKASVSPVALAEVVLPLMKQCATPDGKKPVAELATALADEIVALVGDRLEGATVDTLDAPLSFVGAFAVACNRRALFYG